MNNFKLGQIVYAKKTIYARIYDEGSIITTTRKVIKKDKPYEIIRHNNIGIETRSAFGTRTPKWPFKKKSLIDEYLIKDYHKPDAEYIANYEFPFYSQEEWLNKKKKDSREEILNKLGL